MDRFILHHLPIPNALIQFIRQIGRLSKDLVSALIRHRSKSPAIPVAEDKHQTIFNNSIKSGCCYGYHANHLRPTYDIDTSSSRMISNPNDAIVQARWEQRFVGGCNKYYQEFKSMSNGIAVFKCLEHQEIMGFHVLKTPEGLDDYFATILMLYPNDSAPEMVLCDNACQMQRYFMHREPKKFCNTLFLNDQFHCKGHKCGAIYDIKYYKESIVAEVRNMNKIVVQSLEHFLSLSPLSFSLLFDYLINL